MDVEDEQGIHQITEVDEKVVHIIRVISLGGTVVIESCELAPPNS